MATYICKCPVRQVLKRFSGVFPKTTIGLLILGKPMWLCEIRISVKEGRPYDTISMDNGYFMPQ